METPLQVTLDGNSQQLYMVTIFNDLMASDLVICSGNGGFLLHGTWRVCHLAGFNFILVSLHQVTNSCTACDMLLDAVVGLLSASVRSSTYFQLNTEDSRRASFTRTRKSSGSKRVPGLITHFCISHVVFVELKTRQPWEEFRCSSKGVDFADSSVMIYKIERFWKVGHYHCWSVTRFIGMCMERRSILFFLARSARSY